MEISDARYLISNANYKDCPKPDRPEYAFIGRSNVGKSSLINMICGNRKLAKTSATPGKTQLINHFAVSSTNNASEGSPQHGIRDWYLVDLPGYGFAKVARKDRSRWEEMINGYIRNRENLVMLFVLIDSRHDPQQIDLDFINQLGAWEVPFSIVFTKTDKNKDGGTAARVSGFLKRLEATWEELPAHFVTSSMLHQGKDELLSYIGNLNRELVRK